MTPLLYTILFDELCHDQSARLFVLHPIDEQREHFVLSWRDCARLRLMPDYHRWLTPEGVRQQEQRG